MAPYFFRVEHDLLRSESFKALGGSAIKVYLVDRALFRLRHGLGLPEHPDDRPPGGTEPADGPGGDRGTDPAGPAGHQQVEGAVDRLQDHPPGPGPPAPAQGTGARSGPRIRPALVPISLEEASRNRSQIL